MPEQSQPPIPCDVPRKGRKRNTSLSGVPRTRPTPPTIVRKEPDPESSSGSEEGDSDSSDTILSEGSDSDTDSKLDGMGTRDLYIELARVDGIAKYHYDQYRTKNAKRNTIKLKIKSLKKGRKIDLTQNQD